MAKDQSIALPSSTVMELAESSIQMEGKLEFVSDPVLKPVKAVSSTEWMHRRRAQERGRQVRCEVCVCACVHACMRACAFVCICFVYIWVHICNCVWFIGSFMEYILCIGLVRDGL